MRTKEEIEKINKRINAKKKSGEILVHKNFSAKMSVAEKFRYNLCSKIQEVKLNCGLSNASFVEDGVTLGEMNRVQHMHYDYFETDRLLEILNIVLVRTKSGKTEDIKIAV